MKTEINTVAELLEFLKPFGPNTSTVDTYGQVLVVDHNTKNYGEDIVFAPGDHYK